ncbi:MAG: hypothetical protein MI754_15095 [Chromatiales bacterium]|nr:hypothetical protein [Chromatiales bacterium]
MKVRKQSLLVIMVLAVVMGCQSQNANTKSSDVSSGSFPGKIDVPLEESELRTLLSQDRVYEWSNVNGRSGTGSYLTNGVAKAAWAGGSAEGRWSIQGRLLCRTFKTMNHGIEQCWLLYRRGPKSYSLEGNGRYQGTITFN